MDGVSGALAKRHLRLYNKQVRKFLIPAISKMNSEEAVAKFKQLFETMDDGKAFRPKKDLSEILEGESWDIEAFRALSKKKPRKPRKPKEPKPAPKPTPKPPPKPKDPEPAPKPAPKPEPQPKKSNRIDKKKVQELAGGEKNINVFFDRKRDGMTEKLGINNHFTTEKGGYSLTTLNPLTNKQKKSIEDYIQSIKPNAEIKFIVSGLNDYKNPNSLFPRNTEKRSPEQEKEWQKLFGKKEPEPKPAPKPKPKEPEPDGDMVTKERAIFLYLRHISGKLKQRMTLENEDAIRRGDDNLFKFDKEIKDITGMNVDDFPAIFKYGGDPTIQALSYPQKLQMVDFFKIPPRGSLISSVLGSRIKSETFTLLMRILKWYSEGGKVPTPKFKEEEPEPAGKKLKFRKIEDKIIKQIEFFTQIPEPQLVDRNGEAVDLQKFSINYWNVMTDLGDLNDDIAKLLAGPPFQSKYVTRADKPILKDRVRQNINRAEDVWDLFNNKKWFDSLSDDLKKLHDNVVAELNFNYEPNKRFYDPKKTPLKPEEIDVQREVIKDLEGLVTRKGTNFICYDPIQDYVFLKILEKNKNDCIIDFAVDLKSGDIEDMVTNKDDFEVEWRKNQLGLASKFIDRVPVVNRIAKVYKDKCKMKKLLVMPMNITGASHLNAVIINPFLKKVEWYEPHGEGYGGAKATAQQKKAAVDKRFEKMTERLNKKLPADQQLTFSTSQNTCPLIPKDAAKKLHSSYGLQTWENFFNAGDIDPSPDLLPGTIQKRSGFCCMWSFLQMDLRLRRPKLPENKLSSVLMEAFKANPVKFWNQFIHGYAESMITDLIKAMGGVKNLRKFYKDTPYSTAEGKEERYKNFTDAYFKVYKKIIGDTNK